MKYIDFKIIITRRIIIDKDEEHLDKMITGVLNELPSEKAYSIFSSTLNSRTEELGEERYLEKGQLGPEPTVSFLVSGEANKMECIWDNGLKPIETESLKYKEKLAKEYDIKLDRISTDD